MEKQITTSPGFQIRLNEVDIKVSFVEKSNIKVDAVLYNILSDIYKDRFHNFSFGG